VRGGDLADSGNADYFADTMSKYESRIL